VGWSYSSRASHLALQKGAFFQDLQEQLPWLAQGETLFPVHVTGIEQHHTASLMKHSIHWTIGRKVASFLWPIKDDLGLKTCGIYSISCESGFHGQDSGVLKVEMMTQVYAMLSHG